MVPCIHNTVRQTTDFLRVTLLRRLANHGSEPGFRVSDGLTPHIPRGVPAQPGVRERPGNQLQVRVRVEETRRLSTGCEYREPDVQGWSFWTTLGTLYSGSVKRPLKLSDQERIWRTALPIALLVLVITTTLGGVWHRHAISSPDACPICHLSHQAIEPTPASTRVYILVPTGPGPEPQHYSFILSLAARHIPARAPPA
jgi:hypothetical protein